MKVRILPQGKPRVGQSVELTDLKSVQYEFESRRGDDQLIEKLVNDNLWLAKTLVSKFRFDPDEAFSAALQGLHKAAIKFVTKKDCLGNFEAWATKIIKDEICNIGIRENAVKRGGRVQKVSLNAEFEESGTELSELIADDKADTIRSFDQAQVASRLRRLLGKLTPKERTVLRERFGIDGRGAKSLSEVSKFCGISQTNVKRAEASGLAKLLEFETTSPKETIRKGQRKYKQSHRVQINQTSLAYYHKNKPRISHQRKAAYIRNREKHCLRSRLFREVHKALVLQWAQRYRENHREILCEKQKARYHRQKSNPAFIANRAAFRAKNRRYQRAYSKSRSERLTDGYVREQLSKRYHRPAKTFTIDEVEKHRVKIAKRRTRWITEAQVNEIKRNHNAGTLSLKLFAERLGCCPSTIWNIATGKTRVSAQLEKAA